MESVQPDAVGIHQTPTTAREFYQRTLPYVRAHDDAGQFELWGDGSPGPITLDRATAAAAELVSAFDADPAQLDLFTFDGIKRDATWRRHSDGGPECARAWHGRDGVVAGIVARARYSGRPWCDGDQRTLEDLYAQTWGAFEAARVWTSQPWIVDVVVCPITGEPVRFPKPDSCRRIVELLIAAWDAGVGGIVMGHAEWAAQLRCSLKSVRNYMHELVAIGAVRVEWIRRAHPEHGTVRHHKWYRLGPVFERYAALLAAGRRDRSTSSVREAGRIFRRELEARAARRRFDVAGAIYRGRFGRAVNTRGPADGRTREAKRQIIPHSPPLAGLSTTAPLAGGPGKGARSARVTPLAGRELVEPTSSAESGRASLAPPRAATTAVARVSARLEGEGSAELLRQLGGDVEAAGIAAMLGLSLPIG